jgi:uncharacterized protein (DUF1501 family)
MDRREFVKTLGSLPIALSAPQAVASPSVARRLLILIELKGGNDGLNTLVPYADAHYYALRPRLAVARDHVLQLDARSGLHPALAPLMPLWASGELAIVQGLGYPGANLSHFRSSEIWDTASECDQHLEQGWLSRAFAQAPAARGYAADGVVVGGHDLGPLAGSGARALALPSGERFLRQARLAAHANDPALRRVSHIERDIGQAGWRSDAGRALGTDVSRTPFGNAVRTASQIVASRAGVAAVKISLDGFDTHSDQADTHARLLHTLAEGMAALRQALVELERWDSTLVATYAEFGRRPRQNASGGTDHGTAAVHFLAGGRVRGGLHGPAPALDRLDADGNLPFAIDFRELYATVLERWWGIDSAGPLAGRFRPLDLIRA